MKHMTARIEEMRDAHLAAFHTFFADNIENIAEAADIAAQALKNGHKLLFCGNGGSAADCQHIAAEFVGRFVKDRKALPAIALTTDTSALTCIGNDYGYDALFARQVEGLGNEGDVLFALSTSGNSQNVIEAIEAAKARNLKIVMMTGKDGGKMKDLNGHVVLHASAKETAHIQECHMASLHIVCDLIEKELGLV